MTDEEWMTPWMTPREAARSARLDSDLESAMNTLERMRNDLTADELAELEDIVTEISSTDLAEGRAAYNELVLFANRHAASVLAAERSAQQSANASQPRQRDEDMHDEVRRIGRSVARTHAPHEITGIVRQRMASPPSAKTVRKILRGAEIIAGKQKKGT